MVFGFGKKPAQKTFKHRVAEFWKWYPQVADRFFQTIERKQCESLAGEVSKFMNSTLPDMAWVFGPGEGGGHSFTVSGEGVVAKQLLAEYWLSRAVSIPHWTFYGSRQPSDIEHLKGMAIRLGEHESIDSDSFLIRTDVVADEEKIDIVAWHPALKLVPEEDHYQIFFLLLDEALGEFGTEMWLGEIKIEPFETGTGVISLTELPAKIQQVNHYYQWKKLPPLHSYSVYELNEQTSTPRGDTLVGSTCIPRVILEFLNKGRIEDNPLEGTGAEFAYLAIDGSVFPQGEQTAVRSNIEDVVSDALVSAASGRTLDGAFGFEKSYIDLILFDGDESRKIIHKVLDGLQLRGRATIEHLA
ncbi:MAG: hypothetical protein JNL67_04820 [Planctomycetaceae bacterium]|nr:hypothetical protein [Planctomycetaceae bacterium]